MEHLKLIIPSLLIDPKVVPIESFASQIAVKQTEALLARSVRKQGLMQGSMGALLEHYGVPVQPNKDLPVAPISRLGDGGSEDDAYWLRLDPVYLHPDRDSMVMFSNEAMVVELDEAKALASEVEAHFADLNWKIEVLHPKRWYLRLEKDPLVRTYGLNEVVGRHVFDFFPFGETGRQWHSLLNEIQMLLHASPVNVARQSKGHMPINALWPWGGGRLPVISHNACAVYGSDELVRGMMSLAGGRVAANVSGFEALMIENDTALTPVVILDNLARALDEQNIQQWLDGLHLIDSTWFSPIRNALKSNTLKQLTLYTADGAVLESSAKMQRRLWCKRRSILTYASSE